MKENKNVKFERRDKSINPEMIYGKMAPQAPDLEGSILGALLIEPHRIAEVTEIIPHPECFYVDANQRIYCSIRRIIDRGGAIDFMTVCEDLRKNNELEMAGGRYYVIGLTRDVVSAVHIEEHCRIVMQKYLMREVIRISGELIVKSYENDTDAFELLQQAEDEITKLAERNIQTPYQHISDGAAADLDEIQQHRERIKENGIALTGINTGYATLNRITNGWQKSDFIVLGARPAVGKTAFALNLALNAGIPVGFFSLEMSVASIRKRIMAMQTQIGLTNITSAQMSDIQFDTLAGNLNKLRGLPLYVDDSSLIKVFDIKAKARRMYKKHGVRMIIIDYLQLAAPKNERSMREQQIAQISRECKILAKELQIPVIALSQLNREVDKQKSGKEPQLSDLRESGAIEQDADIVAFLYRFDTITRLRIAKHRNGKLDHVDFIPNMDIQTFAEVGTDFPGASIEGFNPTEHSGRLIPIAEANKKFEDYDDEPF